MRLTNSALKLPTIVAALAVLSAYAPAALRAQSEGKEAGKEEPKAEKVPVPEIGKSAPAFELKDLDGKTVKLADFKDKTVVLEWFNPACPYCVYAYGEKGPLRKMPEELQKKGIVWLSIVSERPDNKGGKVESIKEFMKANEMKVPMLLDPDGKVGRTYAAKTTPHMFVIDGKGILVYRGALDNAPGGQLAKDQQPVNYVEAALADLAAKREIQKNDTKPYG